MTKTVLIGGLAHESNTFTKEPTEREDFKQRGEYIDEELITELRGTNTEIGGIIDVAEDHGVTLKQTVYAEAMPGGIVTGDCYEFYTEYIANKAEALADDLDGVVLVLHGAMVPEGIDDGEGPIVKRIREIIGTDTPLVVTLDPHGNITDEVVDHADALVAYEEYPHVDRGDTGRRGMQLLLDIIDNKIDPVMSIERPPMVLFGPKTSTREGPGREIMQYARTLEQREKVRKVNVFYGFWKADKPSSGVSVVTITDGDEHLTQDTADNMAEKLWSKRKELIGEQPKPDAAVRRAKQYINKGEKPVVLCDIGDDVAAGTAGDGTPLLREMIDQRIGNSGFASIYDPNVVDQSVDAGVGNRLTVNLGGKHDDLHGDPIYDLDVYVHAITDGQFTNQGPVSTGSEINLGKTVLLECGHRDQVSVIVNSERGVPLDEEIWRHIGIQPQRLDAYAIKSEIFYGPDDDVVGAEAIYVDTPGLWSVNPENFEFTGIDRPKYPLDDLDDDYYP